MFCGNCGAKIDEGARFCQVCGVSTDFIAKKEEVKYSNIFKRLLAAIIDLVIVIALFFSIFFFMGIVIGFYGIFAGVSDTDSLLTFTDSAFFGAFTNIFLFAIFIFYFSYLNYKKEGTIGKSVFKMRVVDEDFKSLTFSKSLIRTFSSIISSITFFGYLVQIFTSKNQSLHDLIAKTVVIDK